MASNEEERRLSLAEWREERRLNKAAPGGPSTRYGGVRTNIPANLPALPNRDLGPYPPRTPYNGGNSQYNNPNVSMPPPEIEDVDLNSNWYSPFQPMWPFGPPYQTSPREWDYPVGYNLNYIQPRMDLIGMLRGM